MKGWDKARCCDAFPFSEAGLGDAEGLGYRQGSSREVLQKNGHWTPLALLNQAGSLAMVWEQQPEVLLAPTGSALQKSQTLTRANTTKQKWLQPS